MSATFQRRIQVVVKDGSCRISDVGFQPGSRVCGAGRYVVYFCILFVLFFFKSGNVIAVLVNFSFICGDAIGQFGNRGGIGFECQLAFNSFAQIVDGCFGFGRLSFGCGSVFLCGTQIGRGGISGIANHVDTVLQSGKVAICQVIDLGIA